ncbi:unnamed protein product [Lota lota]
MTNTGFTLTGHKYSMSAMSQVKAFDFFSMEASLRLAHHHHARTTPVSPSGSSQLRLTPLGCDPNTPSGSKMLCLIQYYVPTDPTQRMRTEIRASNSSTEVWLSSLPVSVVQAASRHVAVTHSRRKRFSRSPLWVRGMNGDSWLLHQDLILARGAGGRQAAGDAWQPVGKVSACPEAARSSPPVASGSQWGEHILECCGVTRQSPGLTFTTAVAVPPLCSHRVAERPTPATGRSCWMLLSPHPGSQRSQRSHCSHCQLSTLHSN